MSELPEANVVELSTGAVRGNREGGLSVFRGIPFAEPPTGERRFLPPQPVSPWSGVRDATQFGAAPPQSRDIIVERLGMVPDVPTDEDCLTLNVWTPGTESGSRPILVWIHGGAFINGTGSVPLYAGAKLAERGDAVVVTLNYRVGALGFLYLGHLDGAPSDADNLGLQDQMAALRFVKQNASAFGGDPDRITVFGESAGAGSIASLLGSPSARGLFRRAIPQSGAPRGMIDTTEAARRTDKLLGVLEIQEKSFDALRDVSTSALMAAQDACAADGPYDNGMLFTPVVGGSVLPRIPLESIAAGNARGIDLMIGTTREEMQLYNWEGAPGPTPGFSLNDELLEKILALQLGGTADSTVRAKALISAYQRAREDRGVGTSPDELFSAIQTDFALRIPAIELATSHAAHHPATWMYLFTWPSPIQGGALGACHVIDVPFVLGNLDAPGMREFAGSGEAAARLAANSMDAWLAFAHTGDPSHDRIGRWPRYDTERRATMTFGEECVCVDAPLEAERAAWDA